ncbi:hypothetical protein, partial [Nocardia wallacei]|uniref:hypothetical protein n=1 Tax=Nocardia wallacei TaxID=480035 RepID=UPI002455EA8D
QAWLGDPSAIDIPTFVTGGWHDLFTYSESKIYNQIALPPGPAPPPAPGPAPARAAAAPPPPRFRSRPKPSYQPFWLLQADSGSLCSRFGDTVREPIRVYSSGG